MVALSPRSEKTHQANRSKNHANQNITPNRPDRIGTATQLANPQCHAEDRSKLLPK